MLRFRSTLLVAHSSQRGQVGVVILLIMVVLLTVGLAVASRSSQELFLTQQNVDSTRVFNAAEAGIDQALSSSFIFDGQTSSGQITNFNNESINVGYDVTKVTQLETRLFEMLSVKIDVSGNGGNGILIEWSKLGDCATQDVASLVASVYYDDAGTTRVRYYPIRGCERGDNFAASTTLSGGTYSRSYLLPLTPDDLFVRLKPVYNDTHVRVTGSGWTLPVQYYNVRAEASNTMGTETRIVEVNQTLATAPSVFDYAIFSATTLVK